MVGDSFYFLGMGIITAVRWSQHFEPSKCCQNQTVKIITIFLVKVKLFSGFHYDFWQKRKKFMFGKLDRVVN